MDSLSGQANSFGLMILAGVLVGLLFDLFRILKGRLFARRKVTSFFWDLFYCFLAAAIIYYCTILGSWGELRFYLLVGAFGGILLYFMLASRIVIRLLVWAIRGIDRGGQAVTVGARSLYYHGVNLGVRFGRRTGLDKVVRKGRKKVGALQEKVEQLKPKFRMPGRPKRQKVEEGRVNKPTLGKRLQRRARIFSARTRNLARGLGRGIKVKR